MRPATTAEWTCTRCGATNRKLVPAEATEASDRCVNCKAKHVVHPAPRPVRWESRLAS
ncbi:MAG TPA: hypothetical protein VFS07_07235 [Gemmatimonadales bacterium]|jgi:hypothetical protein|nr:hypothetical protein [Gemmatimonadales bacterium]